MDYKFSYDSVGDTKQMTVKTSSVIGVIVIFVGLIPLTAVLLIPGDGIVWLYKGLMAVVGLGLTLVGLDSIIRRQIFSVSGSELTVRDTKRIRKVENITVSLNQLAAIEQTIKVVPGAKGAENNFYKISAVLKDRTIILLASIHEDREAAKSIRRFLEVRTGLKSANEL